MNERVFFVSNVDKFRTSGIPFYFTNVSCNTLSVKPSYNNNLDNIEKHIDWTLFDENPIVAQIPEIGYAGVTGYFGNKDTDRYRNRDSQRMAEFLVKAGYPPSTCRLHHHKR